MIIKTTKTSHNIENRIKKEDFITNKCKNVNKNVKKKKKGRKKKRNHESGQLFPKKDKYQKNSLITFRSFRKLRKFPFYRFLVFGNLSDLKALRI